LITAGPGHGVVTVPLYGPLAETTAGAGPCVHAVALDGGIKFQIVATKKEAAQWPVLSPFVTVRCNWDKWEEPCETDVLADDSLNVWSTDYDDVTTAERQNESGPPPSESVAESDSESSDTELEHDKSEDDKSHRDLIRTRLYGSSGDPDQLPSNIRALGTQLENILVRTHTFVSLSKIASTIDTN
jgi:hypothetical protein